MIIEKFILVGIKFEEEYIKDITLVNNSNTSYGNNLNIGFDLTLIKEWNNNIFYPDKKKFMTKQGAINFLEQIKYQYTNVEHWTILNIYEDILDLMEIRKYKLNKILKRI